MAGSELRILLVIDSQGYESFDAVLVQRFDQLEQAIQHHQTLSFHYQKRDGDSKQYHALQPYRLTNHGGIWYLAAVDDEQVKSFAISRMSLLSIHSTHFSPNNAIVQQLNDDDSVWLGQKQTPITYTCQACHWSKTVAPRSTHSLGMTCPSGNVHNVVATT